MPIATAPCSAPAAGASGTTQPTSSTTGEPAGSADDGGPSDSPDPDPPQPSTDAPPTSGSVHNDAITISAAPPLCHGLDLDWLRDRLNAAVNEIGAAVQRLDVQIVDDTVMAGLHKRFRDDDSTTDVLTFADASAGNAAIDADIAVCIDEAARQAAARSDTVEREVLLYALHGVLHAIGFDDRDDAAYSRMHAEEDRILSAIGVGAVFHHDDARSPGDDGGASDRNRHPGSAR